jgi:hypothetical protein
MRHVDKPAHVPDFPGVALDGVGFADQRFEAAESVLPAERSDSAAIGMAAVDHGRKPFAEVDDLNQSERAANVDHATQRILPVRLPDRDFVAGLTQPFGHGAEVADGDVHTQIDVFRMADVPVGSESRCADQHRMNAAAREAGGDPLSGREQRVRIRHEPAPLGGSAEVLRACLSGPWTAHRPGRARPGI